LDRNEVRIILDNNKNITTIADPVKALSNKKQEIDRKATEKFHAVKKKWEDFDKPIGVSSIL